MHSCTGIPGKQCFLRDIPGVAGIVGRYVMDTTVAPAPLFQVTIYTS